MRLEQLKWIEFQDLVTSLFGCKIGKIDPRYSLIFNFQIFSPDLYLLSFPPEALKVIFWKIRSNGYRT